MLTLEVNFVRTVLSAKFIADDAIFGVIVTSHTHPRNVMSQPKYGQIIINCGLTLLIASVFPAPLAKHDTV